MTVSAEKPADARLLTALTARRHGPGRRIAGLFRSPASAG
jgi:hypothetical protein